MTSAMTLRLICQQQVSSYHFTVTVRVSRVRVRIRICVRIRVRFSVGDTVGVGLSNVE